MKIRSSSITIAAAVLAVTCLTASAQIVSYQEYYGQPHTPNHPTAYFYFGGGPSFQQPFTLRGYGVPPDTKIDFNTGARFDFAAGVRGRDWAVEFQTGVVYNEVKTFAGSSLSGAPFSLELYQVPLMVNGYYFIPVQGPVRPYIGAGIGGVESNFRTDSSYYYYSDNYYETTFGYQGMAGINCHVADRWEVDLSYRFLGTTDHDLGGGWKTDGTRNHSVLAAFRFNF